MSEIKMKNCPFCGEELREDTARDGTKFYFHYGDNGCFLGYVCITGEKSINAWNSRKPMERIAERLEEQEEHCLEMHDWNGQTAICNAIEIVKEEGGV